jgi:hypothetical protein
MVCYRFAGPDGLENFYFPLFIFMNNNLLEGKTHVNEKYTRDATTLLGSKI